MKKFALVLAVSLISSSFALRGSDAHAARASEVLAPAGCPTLHSQTSHPIPHGTLSELRTKELVGSLADLAKKQKRFTDRNPRLKIRMLPSGHSWPRTHYSGCSGALSVFLLSLPPPYLVS